MSGSVGSGSVSAGSGSVSVVVVAVAVVSVDVVRPEAQHAYRISSWRISVALAWVGSAGSRAKQTHTAPSASVHA